MGVNSPLPAAARRILLVLNPAAGGARRGHVDRIVAVVRALGCEISTVETVAVGHAETIARAVSDDQFDVIVAGGGDGTVNEIVNGLAGKSIALGLIPLGTANVLADEIGLGRAAEEIARTLASGPIRTIHVGRANDRRFVMMAGVGFDAAVVNAVSLPLKKILGPLAYVWESVKLAATYKFDECDVCIDGVAYRSVSVVACNGRRYGGPFIAAPQASLSEDTFHIILMSGRGWLSVLRYGAGLVLGRLTAWRDVKLMTGREIVISGVTGWPVQADGDIIATLPLRITIDPDPVRLVYPA